MNISGTMQRTISDFNRTMMCSLPYQIKEIINVLVCYLTLLGSR
jgi:hypothetical protein